VQRLLVLPILLASALVAATWVATAPSADATSSSPQARSASEGSRSQAQIRRIKKIRAATRVASRQKGDPYVYGAAGPNSFDCSGLTYFAYGKVGINLPRSSDAQYRHLRHIKKKNLKRGDMIFFHSGGSVYHLGIFVGRKNGERMILHSPNSGSVVNRDPVWTGQWYAGTLRRR
jgi:cell wall-associated NlpC family hydrolase